MRVGHTLLRAGLLFGALALSSCSKWDYQFINPYDPDASFDAVVSDASVESHYVSGGEKWSGTINLKGILTVPRNCALYVEPGTVVTVDSYASVGIYIENDGAIYALGTERAPILFTSSVDAMSAWNGISSRGITIVEYCHIKNASCGIEFSHDQHIKDRIKNSCFDNCKLGLWNSAYSDETKATVDRLSFISCTCGFQIEKPIDLSYCYFFGCAHAVYIRNGYVGLEAHIGYSNFESSSVFDINSLDSSAVVSLSNCYPVSPTTAVADVAVNGSPYAIASGQPSSIADAGCGFDYTK